MAELQATIEISVELNRFFNVDLFQRGYYQIQTVLKTLKPLARVEISDNKVNALRGSPESAAVFKQCCVGKSRKFQILYRNEEVSIGDIFIFRIHTLVESAKLEKNLENLDLRLDIQLWCNQEDEAVESEDKMELASSRTLLLHLSPTKGLHHFLPVLFDYFHLSAVEVVIHGTVVAIHQPYLTLPKSQKTGKGSDQSSLEAVYFGQKIANPPSNVTSSSVRMQQAHLMHKTICNILLSAHESLENYLQQYAAMLPGNNFQLGLSSLHTDSSISAPISSFRSHKEDLSTVHELRSTTRKDCLTKLGETVMKVQGVLEEDDLIQTALTDITQLCAENVILWAQFLEIVLKQPQVHLHLATEHHTQRVRRFAEAFFTLEHNKSSCLSCYDPGFHGHSSLASMVKNSPYFCNVPCLPVECIDLDGNENSLPIIFEDIFRDARAPPPQMYQKAAHSATDSSIAGPSRERSSSNSSSSLASDRGTPPHLRKRSSKKSFIRNMKPEGLKRPSSYYCSDAEAATAKLENRSTLPAGVTLTGYRKIPDAVPSGAVQLGINNPYSSVSARVLGPDVTSHLERTYSLPLSSSFSRTRLKDTIVESVPDVCQPDLIVPATSAHLTGVVSKFDLSDISVHDETSHVPAFSIATLTQSPCIYLKQAPSSSDSPATVTSKPPIPPTARDPIVSSSGVKKSLYSSSLNDHQSSTKMSLPAAQESSTYSPAELTKEDINNLVDDISQALGEKECTSVFTAVASSNDDDFSDDETNITNGFNDAIGTYRHDFSSSQSSCDKIPTLKTDSVSQLSVSQDQGSSLSLSDKFSDIPHTSESRNIDSALGSEISSQEEISSSSSPSTTVRIPQHNKTTTMPVTAATVTSPNIGHSCTDPQQKVTVIELLKEEYRLSKEGGHGVLPVNDSSTTMLAHTSEPSPLGCHRAASDSDILRNCEEKLMNSQKKSQELLLSKTSIDGNEKKRALLTSSSSYPELSHSIIKHEPLRLVSFIGHHTVNFVQLRESLKLQMDFPGSLYSECTVLASSIPYFYVPSDVDESSSGIHLIVCVHGLDGNSADLRLLRTYIEMALPGFKLEFLMSERNQQDTFADFDKMTDRLVDEILTFLDTFGLQVTRISFVGHSLGNIIIRSTLSRPEMSHLLPKLYTFLSLSGPHLGTLYNSSGIVNMGLWLMQKWKKSGSLLQLSLKDHSDPRQTFLYRLSQKPVLQNFKHVLLVGSHQDRYIPYHSSRIEICRSAQKDSTVIGAVYREMVQNILEPIIQSPHCTLIRYDVFHALPSSANTMIGRAAHIAVLDSEIFIEKFLSVIGLKYFQ